MSVSYENSAHEEDVTRREAELDAFVESFLEKSKRLYDVLDFVPKAVTGSGAILIYACWLYANNNEHIAVLRDTCEELLRNDSPKDLDVVIEISHPRPRKWTDHPDVKNSIFMGYVNALEAATNGTVEVDFTKVKDAQKQNALLQELGPTYKTWTMPSAKVDVSLFSFYREHVEESDDMKDNVHTLTFGDYKFNVISPWLLLTSYSELCKENPKMYARRCVSSQILYKVLMRESPKWWMENLPELEIPPPFQLPTFPAAEGSPPGTPAGTPPGTPNPYLF